ncbi:NAD(P)-binding protein [Pleomassaria siparia CBS 279.74]|uniref:NAD(P)-binding protein n=1 Tax=Pleomassaria siparia CBS 279.74 TaxID=1314801 RepID=A0A6G1KBJ2_9PLEO|nr:NAD(P)-binding protein [Pleomassaria siparia CBS 279.74]
MSAMRIAVAGTSGLARIIARQIHESTSHQLLILSRSPPADLVAQGYQCQIVDYYDSSSIRHSLMGVDTIISTVTGNEQIRLIEGAVASGVRRFAPAEFEGLPRLRPQGDPLDRGRAAALALLQVHYSAWIHSTVFVCGILYERFAVGGMRTHCIGVNTGYGNEGDYILDARNMTATVPGYDSEGNLSSLCMTSARDVGKFVVRALDLPSWPKEMSMCGERMTVSTLINTVQACRGRTFNAPVWQNPQGLQYELTLAQMAGEISTQWRLATLIATAEGRYDYGAPGYLNTQFPDITPVTFQAWFQQNWAAVPRA